MGLLGGSGDVATDLLRVLVTAADEGHHRRRLIAPLFLHHREIHGTGINPRRRPGFQPADVERQLPQPPGQGIGRRVTGTATGMVLHANVDNATQEGTGGEHHGAGMEADAGLGYHAGHPVAFHQQIVCGLLEQGQIGLVLQQVADRCLVQDAIGLGTGRPHRRALAAVEYPELDAGLVGRARHGTAEGIDFLHQVALANATNGRIAGHLAKGFNVMGQQQGLRPHAGSSQCRLGTGMATTNDNHIETGRKIHTSPQGKKGNKNQAAEYNASPRKMQSECANFNQLSEKAEGGKGSVSHHGV